MKKIILSGLAVTVSLVLSAQLKVVPNGSVGIGFNNPGGAYKLEVKGSQLLSNYPASNYSELSFHVGEGWPGTTIGSSKDWITFYRPWLDYHNIVVSQLFNSSDKKLKSNIEVVTNGLEKIKKLTPYIYDIRNNSYGLNKEKIEGTRRSYGFISQEVEEIFKEVKITQDANDIKSMDYLQIIPIAVSAIKEQQVEIEKLREKIQEMESSSFGFDNDTQNEAQLNKLFQNKPNPFSSETTIGFNLNSSNFKSGKIIIFDMNGTLVSSKNIESRQQKITISRKDLKPGMYLYTLVVNDKEIDTKRMILTD